MRNQAAIALLDNICWLPALPCSLDAKMWNWLTEHGSMTRRLGAYCRQISVWRCCEGFISASSAKGNIANLLPPDDRLWLRKVVLYGDARPWLAAQTMVSEKAAGLVQELMKLRDMPLGRWLFRAQTPARDFIQLGQVNGLWARRLRLYAEGEPLILIELFLPESPLYKSCKTSSLTPKKPV